MSAVDETDQKDENPEGKTKKKRNAFSSPSGDRVRAEYRRSGLLNTLIAGALGGTAYGVHRGADKFLPAETRRALEDTERIFGQLQRTKTLSGEKLNPDDVIEAYVTQASRLATAPVAGMQGREFVKLLRTKLPSDHPWQPHYSDAHYDAFARGPAYAAAQVIDEKAEELAKNPAVNEKLRKYLALKWPDKFSDKVNATAASNGVSPMNVGPSLRESLAYNGITMPKEKQLAVAQDIIRGDRFNKDRIPLFGGFADRYTEVKKNLSNGLMTHSFPNYVGLGHKARGAHKALSMTIPAILGAAGVGVGGYGLYKLVKSLRRTAYEKRMMEKADREGFDSDADEVKKQAAAIGLPDRSNFGDISQLKEGDLLDLIVQEHLARRAGKHFDVRLGDPDRELFSWATRKGLPDVPGRAHQLFRQPLHTYGYKDFEGEIPEGYGAGVVKKILEQKVLTTRSDAGGISFTGPKGDRFRFTKQNGTWIATKAKPLKPPGHLKEHMKSVSPDDVGKLDIQSAEPKIDGALHLMRLGVDPELISHRISKRHGGPIVHTERVFGGRPKLDAGKIPAELRASELLGEVYAQRKGKMLTPEELGGLLNSDLDKSIAKQRAENIKMRLALHGISGGNQPREQQRQLLAQVAALLPDTLEVTPEVKGRENALKLLEQVRAGKHPLTHEGVIIHTPQGPRKVKLSEESDVYVREPFKGTGRLAKLELPGGFTYSNTPKGPIIGRVGSGLSDETRAALADYVGRVARIKHHGVGAKGALKKPSFTALHEDYPTKSAAALSSVGQGNAQPNNNATIADWMRGDDKGLDWRWGLLGPSIVGLPVGMAAQVYGGQVIPRVAGAPRNLDERRLYRGLLDAAKGLKVDVVPGDASKTKMQMTNKSTLSNKLRAMFGIPQKTRKLESSLYNPLLKEVVMVKGMNAPGVLAHELGHAAGGKGMLAANVVGKQGLGISTLLSLLSRDKQEGENSALIGTALGGGLMASELDASRRGYRMLRNLGSGRKAALKSFIGIPAYLAATATPLLAHYTKSRMGGYDTEKRAAEDDEPSAIGKGLGTLFSDFFPFAPSGARRAGAASLMSERLGKDPGLLLKYPMLSQILAAAGGGALAGVATETKANPSTTFLAAVAPYLAVQGLKRRKINKIDSEYKDTKKRKRLREVNAEGMVDDTMGSHRLGMAQAFEAMRTRKLRDISAIAEAGDALPVATTMVGLGPAASLPLTQLIDHLEAKRFREKKADRTDQVADSWTDQVNAPTIPLYLAAAGAGLGGLVLSGKKFHNDLNDPDLKSMPRSEWDGLLKHVAGRDLLSAQVPGLNNAFFARAKNDDEARGLLGYALQDPRVLRRLIFNPTGSKMVDQVRDHGTAMFDPAFGKASIIGHEAGHAKIEHTPGFIQDLQRKLYQYSPVIAPFSAVGGMAAGLASKSPLGGLLAGTGIGLIGGAGMMLPEYMATRHGMKGLETYQGGKWKQDGDWKRQLTALGTYGSINVLPAALAGLLGGYVGKRRAIKNQEEVERDSREAGENPDNVVIMDETARSSEKAANIQKTFQAIERAKQIAKHMGSDSADRYILGQTGSYLKPTIKQFYNNKDVIAAGIKKGMKGTKILDILKSLTQPPAV